jgi:ketosteroid isomerase-like protein
MPAAAPAFSAKTSDDVAVVRDFLDASMKPDAERAANYIAEDFKLTFTGGRTFDHPSGSIGFNAKRYRWVKKAMDCFDVVPGPDETIVYSIGTLYGEWPDGTAFKDNRYIDRFVVRGGKIVRMDVWNDSAERILVRNGIDA